MRRLLILLPLLAVCSANAQTFRPEAIRAHMNFLASDLLEGRGTGARGHQIAAEYVAAQFAAAGVEPGAGESYFQEITFRRTTAESAKITLIPSKNGAAPTILELGRDFTTTGDALNHERTLEAGVVVAGFGITAPDQQHDDYAGIDARSRIVVIFTGAPKRFPNAVRAHYSSTLGKIENAAKHGAAGLIFVSTPRDAQRSSWDRQVRQSQLGSMHWMENDRVPHAVIRGLSHTITLSQKAAETLLGARWQPTLDAIGKGSPKAFALPLRAKIEVASAHERVTSPNVVGMVRGTDLKDEYLVYSSHLDHLGITAPVDGDSINNGALDNASGIAALLEIARNFAAGPKPRRSILFLATTAEEKGLRGADYFANNPTVPFEKIVANINIDQIFMPYAVKDVITLGGETSDLGDLAAQVAGEMRVTISPDPFPDEVFFVRSDQYPFIRRGIPAIYVDPGFVAVDPNVNVQNAMSEWMRTRYHSPKDDLTQTLDYSVATMLAEFDYRLGSAVANRDARPRWKPGDFFGETFGRR